ncbi:MAG: c-type cytochrome [Planctomycetota bacterium]|jgi:mono/diheme cytochrome c family protein
MKKTWLVLALLAGLAAAQEEKSPFQKQATLFAQHCMKCHTVGQGDRVGPDLKNALERREREWLLGFIRQPSLYLDGDDPIAKELLKEFADVRMPDLGITPDQAEGLLAYIETMSKGPAGGAAADLLPEEALQGRVPLPDEGLGVSIAGLVAVLLLLAGGAVLWRLGVPGPAQVVLVLAVAVGYWSLGGSRHHRLLGNDQGYAPTQPMPFSHARHAGELQIACLYCHHGAEKGAVAGIPAVSTCMNCHLVVKKRKDQTDASPEISKLLEIWEAKESIPWVRVHRLPDFVYFNHQVHVRNGLQCQECHGPVETMVEMRQASDLSMGWCVNCHRHADGPAPTHWKRSQATLDCAACHQ